MRQLIGRTVDIRNESIGPKWDPYMRETVELRETYSDGTRFRVAVITCALAEGARLEVDDSVVLDFGQAHDQTVMDEFQRITGITRDRLWKIYHTNYERDPMDDLYGGH